MAFRTIHPSASDPANKLDDTRYGIRHLIIYSPAANEDIYIGDKDVSLVHYSHKLPTGSINIYEIGPFSGDAPCYTDEIYLYSDGDDPVVYCTLITH